MVRLLSVYVHGFHSCVLLIIQGLHLQTQQDGNKNQSMNMPIQSLLGSYARRRCHLYFCSHPQSPEQRDVVVLLKKNLKHKINNNDEKYSTWPTWGLKLVLWSHITETNTTEIFYPSWNSNDNSCKSKISSSIISIPNEMALTIRLMNTCIQWRGRTYTY